MKYCSRAAGRILLELVSARANTSIPKTEQNAGHLYAEDKSDGSSFSVLLNDEPLGAVHWSLFGEHNKANALNAIAAARHAGVEPKQAIDALCEFRGVKRRMEVIYESDNLVVYDDFAHHPTAIHTTLQGLRTQFSQDEIVAASTAHPYRNVTGSLRNGSHIVVLPRTKSFGFAANDYIGTSMN